MPAPYPSKITQQYLADPATKPCQGMPRHLITLDTVLGLLWFSWAPLLVGQRSISCSWMKLITQRGRSVQHLCCELPVASCWLGCCATSARVNPGLWVALRVVRASNMGTLGGSGRYKCMQLPALWKKSLFLKII
jgi:hypothetical protein